MSGPDARGAVHTCHCDHFVLSEADRPCEVVHPEADGVDGAVGECVGVEHGGVARRARHRRHDELVGRGAVVLVAIVKRAQAAGKPQGAAVREKDNGTARRGQTSAFECFLS